MRHATRTALGAIALVAILVCGAASAERIGYINSEKILSDYEGARDIESQLSASVADWKNQAREMEKEIEALLVELSSQRLLLSDEAAAEKQALIQEKRLAYESFANDVWGVGGMAVRREAELWQPVIDKVNTILEDIGTEDEYLMILDAAGAAPGSVIVYADPSADLTEVVIDRLNRETE